jgi:hypothetical protein
MTALANLRLWMGPSAFLVATVALGTAAWAQPTPRTAEPVASPSGGAASVWTIVLILGAAILAIVLLAKLIDRWRAREAEAVAIDSRLADALLRDPQVGNLALTPTIHIPLWRRSPVFIGVLGEAPTPELRDSALRLVRQEAGQLRPDVQVEDRIHVAPTRAQVA